MNPKPAQCGEIGAPADTEFDSALLNRSETILPSSGFAVSVMAAVLEEASAPPPIPFPWRRALPGFAAALLVMAALVAGLYAAWTATAHTALSPEVLSSHAGVLAATVHRLGSGATDALWLLFSVFLTLGCLAFSRRISALG